MSTDKVTPQPSEPGGLAQRVSELESQLAQLRGNGAESQTRRDDHDQPAAWVAFEPPPAAEDRHHQPNGYTPANTVERFVAFYNSVYAGLPGGGAHAIPDCWQQHPGLVAEVATLAYTWRRANIGATANVRDAQAWHHRDRPGFAVRIADWVHPHCLNGRHRDTTSDDLVPAAGPAQQSSSDVEPEPDSDSLEPHSNPQ